MISENYEYSWNKLFQSVEYDIYDILDEKFGCTIYMADPLECPIDLYIEEDDFPAFYTIINEKYHTNLPLHESLLLWEIETEIVKADLLRFFSDKSLPDYLDINLFGIFFDNLEQELKAHLLNVIKNGHFSYLKGGSHDNSEALSIIQMEQTPDELTTTLIIKGSEIGGNYEIIDFFPSMSILQSKQKPIKGMIHYCSENLGALGYKNTDIDFWNFFEPLQYFDFSEGHTNEYLFWGLAFDSNTKFNLSNYNNSAAGINCLQKMKLSLSEIEEKEYLGKPFIKTWISKGAIRIPIFVPKKLLDEKYPNAKELEALVLICGQIQPYEDDLSEITIKMEPEALNLFWNEEGTAIGDTESISVNEHYEVNLDIKGLQEWLWEYENQCLIPCESGDISLDELNKTFDWKSFHDRGLAFAAQVKKLLPLYTELIYCSPFEDRSGIIDSDGILIK
ncbi:MAG: hypothetical protein IJ688_07560 [Treponema sp.]|nr:hypothetical protein [Treponema sp.]